MNKEQIEYLSQLVSFACSDYETEVDKILDNCEALNHLFHMDEYYIKTFGCKDKTAEIIRLAVALNARRITDKFKNGKKYLQKDIEEYICGLFFGSDVETIYMIMFDKEGRFVSTDSLGDGTVNASGFLPRKMVDIAVRKKIHSVILAHNHPLGTTVPSQTDLITTSLAKTVFNDAGVKLLAHYIVAGKEIKDCLSTVAENREEPDVVFKVSAKRSKLK